MRCTTYRKMTANGLQRHTTLHLDCGHTLEYEGSPDDGHRALKSVRGTIGHQGFTRCYECSQAFITTLSEALAEAFPAEARA